MGKENMRREREYDEMERGGVSAAFRRPPWHLAAASMGRKEEGNGIRKKTAYPDGEKRAGGAYTERRA